MFLLQEVYCFLKSLKIGEDRMEFEQDQEFEEEQDQEQELDEKLIEDAKAGDEEAVGKIFNKYKNFV